MKARRTLPWMAGAIVIVLLSVSVALAFSLGNADGIWGVIEGNGDAECSSWASGPPGGSTDYGNPTTHSDSWYDQGGAGGTDWNQVRYGDPAYDGESGCPDGSNWEEQFAQQSGFGFDGANDVTDPDPIDAPFYLGKFCHFNNPIYSDDAMEYVDLDITVDGLGCPSGGTIDKTEFSFTYRFTLDETPNSASPCPYLPGDPINENGCADSVVVAGAALDETFTCDFGAGNVITYTIAVVGFIPESVGGACPGTYDPQDVSTQYITKEQEDNCACLWARVTEYNPTAVDLLSFEATGGRKAITLNWETASEIDNLGFNLYRAEAVGGERVKINAELIPTNVPPGSPFGAVYEYVDRPMGKALTYYYWLEDVDIDGTATLHGPVEASLTKGLGVEKAWRWVVPVKPPVEEEAAEG